ncbi:hypothetical protein BH10ACT11_BH10ACT11_03820 [soil metagenome]
MSLFVSWVAFPALMMVIWLGCGLTAETLTGRRLPGPLLAPIGFCLIVVLGGLTTANSSTAKLTTPLIVLVALLGLVISPPWKRWRGARWPTIAFIVVLAFYAAPIVASGQATFAGYIKLDDTATWMALTDRVMEHGRDLSGLAPSSYYETLRFNLADGYPVGVFLSLGVGQRLIGTDVAWVIQPYLALLAGLLALSLWELSGWALASQRLRALVVVLAAQPALLYGYYLWGGIKELAAAGLIALVAALGPPLVTDPSRWRDLIPIALACGALIGCLSVAGLAWVVPILAVLAIAMVLAAGWGMALRRSAALVGLIALTMIPALAGGSLLPPTSSPLDDPGARGNLISPLSALHALGIWPAGDFRIPTNAPSITYLLCVVVASAAAFGLVHAVVRKAWAPLLYVAGILVAATSIGLYGSPWVDGKALATSAPAALFAALLVAAGLYSAGRRVAGLALALVLATGVIWSNVAQYGGASLAPRDQLAELEDIGHEIADRGPSLMTEYMPYGVRHFLRDSDSEGASELRYHQIPLNTGSPLRKGLWADTDAFDPAGISYRTMVLRRSPEQSRPPSPYHLIDRGEYYETWELDKALPYPVARIGTGSGPSPDAKISCQGIRGLVSQAGPGGSLAAAPALSPLFVARSATTWPASWPVLAGNPVPVSPGVMSADVSVPRAASYAIWIKGSIRSGATLTVDGEKLGAVRHQLNNTGLYVELGSADLSQGKHRLEIEFSGADLHPGSARATDPVGPIALSASDPANSKVVRVDSADSSRLCGRDWDWVEALPGG